MLVLEFIFHHIYTMNLKSFLVSKLYAVNEKYIELSMDGLQICLLWHFINNRLLTFPFFHQL